MESVLKCYCRYIISVEGFHVVDDHHDGHWWPIIFNPLRANFFRGNINIYLHFMSLLHIDTTLAVEIFPQIRQKPTYST